MKATPSVRVIVITHNGRHHLEKCLPSLLRTQYPNYSVWLIDNDSNDGSSEYVAEMHKMVCIVRNRRNFGFAKGNNRVMGDAVRAGEDYVLLLNDDTVVLDPFWISKAITIVGADPSIAMLGFDLTGDLSKRSPSELSFSEVENIDGCALLIRCRVLEDIGLFDEVYFAYGEESDLECRAKRRGYHLVRVNVPVYHAGGGSFGKMPVKFAYLYLRNNIRYSIKNENLCRVFARPFALFDYACSPFPFQRHPFKMAMRRRILANGYMLVWCIFGIAIVWNVFHAPFTVWRRVREALPFWKSRAKNDHRI